MYADMFVANFSKSAVLLYVQNFKSFTSHCIWGGITEIFANNWLISQWKGGFTPLVFNQFVGISVAAALEFSQLQGQDCSFSCVQLQCTLQNRFIYFPMNVKNWVFSPVGVNFNLDWKIQSLVTAFGNGGWDSELCLLRLCAGLRVERCCPRYPEGCCCWWSSWKRSLGLR